ncbi:MAG: hypothetical protein RE468_04515 [Acidithiobacillus caldus]|uniref:hypothetical protein n=1 Tax=Acidithiobacillus caldus TaxID=33059 RepID=UPI002815A461|nr:hypothetical protein [Acidithiobacillus caldus]WMT47881.1 MAG: hypothetical protein RE468_04515 [Acidithiobacillus caldus]
MLGFAGSRWTVQHAEGYLKYALSVGVRFLVLMIWIAFIEGSTHTLLPNLLNGVKHTGGTNIGTTIDAYGNILIFALLIAWLTKKLPSLASSIVSGNSSLSGGSDGAALIASAAAAGLAAVGLTSLAQKGASGALTGSQAANMGGAAGELKGAGGGGAFPGGGGGAGTSAGMSAGGSGGEAAGGFYPGAENAVQAPEPSKQQQDIGLAPTAEQIQAAMQKYPTPPARPAGGSAGQGARATQGAGGSAELGAGTKSGQTASLTDGSGVQANQGTADGSVDSGASASASQSPEVTQGAGGSGAAPSKPASGGGTSASQETPTTSATPPAGQRAPSSQEALRAALQQSIQQAFAPMQESLGKLNETLTAGQQEKPKDFSERLADWQKRHKLAETFLSPGQADSSGVQAANHGLKHSE